MWSVEGKRKTSKKECIMRQVAEAKNAIWSNMYIEATLMWHCTKTRHPESVENPSLYMSEVS